MNSTNDNVLPPTKTLNFTNTEPSAMGSYLRDNVLTAAGANRNVNVVIACDTVTLYGYENEAYAVRAVEQVSEAGGLNCLALVV